MKMKTQHAKTYRIHWKLREKIITENTYIKQDIK